MWGGVGWRGKGRESKGKEGKGRDLRSLVAAHDVIGCEVGDLKIVGLTGGGSSVWDGGCGCSCCEGGEGGEVHRVVC